MPKATWLFLGFAVALLAVARVSGAHAQERTDKDWRFMLGAFAPVPLSIQGTATVRDQSVPVDLDTGAVFDDFQIGGALQFQAWKGRWGLVTDALYLRLGDDGTVGPRNTPFDITTQMFVADALLGFRVAEWQSSRERDAPSVMLELDAGVRGAFLDEELELGTLVFDDSQGFAKGVGAVHVPVRLTEHWALRVRGTVAVPDDVSWTLLGVVEFEAHPVVLNLGYQFDAIDQAGDNVVLDVDTHNIYLSVGFRWGDRPFYP